MERTRWIIVGAGFGGAATAWALARAGLGPGVILEQEPAFGTHASGRNAALVKLSESDPIVRTLVTRSLAAIREMERPDEVLVRRTGGLALASSAEGVAELEPLRDALVAMGVPADVLARDAARARLPLLDLFEFESALWSPEDGVADIHALLTRYLELARLEGFKVRTNTRVTEVVVEGGRVSGVRTDTDEFLRGEVVIDACGAWAGRIGRSAAPLPLTPKRRHLFVSARVDSVSHESPFAWHEDASLYFRPEGEGLLLSPCDETVSEPCLPSVDPAAAELLAEKLARIAPQLPDVAIRRSWACLRTFAPDRHPVIGEDPDTPGLFHVSGLGGFGMMCSAAIGEIAAILLAGGTPDWIEPLAISPSRLSSLEKLEVRS